MCNIIEVSNITKAYGSVIAVNNVSFNIKRGEFFSLLGPSGCGKTTILRIIGGFLNQDSGTVFIDGINMNGRPPNKRDTSMVFQNLALFPHMNVGENIVYGLRKRNLTESEIKTKLSHILTIVNLKGFEKRKISQLSGGQQQRVALARSLIIQPKILLLDEPLASLDKKLRISMRAELKEIQRKTNTTFLYVTHDQSEALTMSDNIAVMNEGKILQIGTPDQIYNYPNNFFVADFIGAGNFIPIVKVKNCKDLKFFYSNTLDNNKDKNNKNNSIKNNSNNSSNNSSNNNINNINGIDNITSTFREDIEFDNKYLKELEEEKNISYFCIETKFGENIILEKNNSTYLNSNLSHNYNFFFIRPEKIKILLNKQQIHNKKINKFFGKIKDITFEGPDVRLKILSQDLGEIVIEAKSDEIYYKNLKQEDEVSFFWNITDGLIL